VRLLPFIDVGDSQGSVDWQRVRERGKAAIGACKATEGQDFRAKTFSAARVKAVHQAGLPLMPYHYLRPRTDRHGSKEAEFAIAVMEDAGWKPRGKRFKRGKDAPMVLDIESFGNEAMLSKMTGAQLLHYADEFAGTVAERTGRDVLTYLSPGFMPELGGKAPAHGKDVWVAAFSFARGKPPTPQGFSRSRVRAHQFSEHGTFPGVGVAVDLDVWMGAAASLRAWIAGDPGPGGGGGPSPEPSLSTRQTQTLLRQIGWPIKVDGKRGPKTAQAIKDFQRGYLGDPPAKPLLQDGLVGPRTEAALRESAANGGRCSRHFTFKEFASSRSGWIRTHRELVVGLEALRAHVGRPIGVLSGFRDFDLGASFSQHKFGNAIDPTATLPHFSEVAALKVFSGIGHFANNGLVRHVDVRHVGPNSTGGTKTRPTIFIDAF
jgi:GH25 family lysozyme M1 (1,4-beta-N-acetylmuramidase)/peptidoglycan hydrolase-like protein with peptidoglycan-binding domain